MFSYRMPVTSVEPLQDFVQGLLGWQSRRPEPSVIWVREEEPLMLWTWDLWSKVPHLSDEALVIRKWCLCINVSWGRDISETSNLKFLSDWGPVEHLLQRTLELTGHMAHVWVAQGPHMGTCLLVPLLTSYWKTGLLVIFSKLFLFSHVFSCKMRWLSELILKHF